jgi:hypothetical protein
MLIQGLRRGDSIVASKLPLADFCNNIGPRLPNRDVSYITVSIGGIADSRGCHQVADFTSEPCASRLRFLARERDRHAGFQFGRIALRVETQTQ